MVNDQILSFEATRTLIVGGISEQLQLRGLSVFYSEEVVFSFSEI